MNRFENRRALITAGATGLGLGVALRLAREGAQVAIWDRDAETLAQVTRQAQDAGLSLHTHKLDMTDGDAITQAADTLLETFGGLDVLVNNIGGSLHTPFRFLDQSEADWDLVMNVNVTACVRTTRAVLPAMVQGGYGRVINMGSKAGRFGSLFAGANYAASKGAMQAFTLQIAQEFGPLGITCNTLCPGAILTPRVERLLSERQSQEERERVLATIPVRRHGTVEDIAAAVAYFASEEAGFVNGASLDINGGQAMVI